jgi:hypothetical protein
MLFGETQSLFIENHMEHTDIYTVRAEYRVWCVKAGGIYSNQWALKG